MFHIEEGLPVGFSREIRCSSTTRVGAICWKTPSKVKQPALLEVTPGPLIVSKWEGFTGADSETLSLSFNQRRQNQSSLNSPQCETPNGPGRQPFTVRYGFLGEADVPKWKFGNEGLSWERAVKDADAADRRGHKSEPGGVSPQIEQRCATGSAWASAIGGLTPHRSPTGFCAADSSGIAASLCMRKALQTPPFHKYQSSERDRSHRK